MEISEHYYLLTYLFCNKFQAILKPYFTLPMYCNVCRIHGYRAIQWRNVCAITCLDVRVVNEGRIATLNLPKKKVFLKPSPFEIFASFCPSWLGWSKFLVASSPNDTHCSEYSICWHKFSSNKTERELFIDLVLHWCCDMIVCHCHTF